MPSWVEALKEWNSGKDKWCIPRKGTEGYLEVRAIMNPEEKPAKATRSRKAVAAEESADEAWARESWKRMSSAKRINYYKQVQKYGVPPQSFAKRGYEAWLKKTEMDE